MPADASTVRVASHPWIDASRAPLYVVTYPEAPSDREVLEGHQAIEEIYRRADSPLAWVVDARRVNKATPVQRRMVAEHEERTRALAEKFNAGLALVITSRLVRGMVTAVYWMSPPVYPYKIFDDMDRAQQWALQQLYDRRRSGSASKDHRAE
jgi:hypothetical protein